MDLTDSYLRIFSSDLTDRYEMREVREAAAVLSSTNPEEFKDIASVLEGFWLEDEDFLEPGGQKGRVAIRLDEAFRLLGWREGRHDTKITSLLGIMPYRASGETEAQVVETEVANEGYKVDNVRGRVALDVEWNAKDGNLDRDLGAYRALYDAGVIAGGVILTRTTSDLRELGADIGRDPFGTTTTTNLEKLLPRLTRGDAGGCPVLAIAATARCYTEG